MSLVGFFSRRVGWHCVCGYILLVLIFLDEFGADIFRWVCWGFFYNEFDGTMFVAIHFFLFLFSLAHIWYLLICFYILFNMYYVVITSQPPTHLHLMDLQGLGVGVIRVTRIRHNRQPQELRHSLKYVMMRYGWNFFLVCYLLWMFTLVCMMVVEILFDDIVSFC